MAWASSRHGEELKIQGRARGAGALPSFLNTQGCPGTTPGAQPTPHRCWCQMPPRLETLQVNRLWMVRHPGSGEALGAGLGA